MLGLKNFPFFDVKAFVTCINPQTTPHLSFAVRYLCAVNLPSSQEICLQDKRTATEVDGCLDKMPLKELGKKKNRRPVVLFSKEQSEKHEVLSNAKTI